MGAVGPSDFAFINNQYHVMTEKKDDDEDAEECLPKNRVQRLACLRGDNV